MNSQDLPTPAEGGRLWPAPRHGVSQWLHLGEVHHCAGRWRNETNIAIENGHRNSGFSHEKWWCMVDLPIKNGDL